MPRKTSAARRPPRADRRGFNEAAARCRGKPRGRVTLAVAITGGLQ